MSSPVDLPYFDMLLAALDKRRPGLSATFGHHVHWGYWGFGDAADGSIEGFAAASERLSRRVCEAGGVRDGIRILDAGCGLGGTMASIDERFSGVDLTGLNIDPRQLAFGRERVKARTEMGNRVAFVEGDACAMPFPDASFDVVLAVECAFHFPSRERFLREARRVLKPGGTLALSDFVPPGFLVPPLRGFEALFGGYVQEAIGHVDVHTTLGGYRAMAEAAGLSAVREDDITANTMPTYPVLRKLVAETGLMGPKAHFCISAVEGAARVRALRYVILSFEARR